MVFGIAILMDFDVTILMGLEIAILMVFNLFYARHAWTRTSLLGVHVAHNKI